SSRGQPRLQSRRGAAAKAKASPFGRESQNVSTCVSPFKYALLPVAGRLPRAHPRDRKTSGQTRKERARGLPGSGLPWPPRAERTLGLKSRASLFGSRSHVNSRGTFQSFTVPELYGSIQAGRGNPSTV